MEILHIFFSVSIFYNFLNNISLNNLFIFDCAGFGCCLGCFLTVASGGYSQLSCPGFSVWWFLLMQSMGSRACGLSHSSFQALEHRINSCSPRAQIVPVQFNSVAQGCPTLCDPMNHSPPGLPVHHQLPESTQTHVHQIGDAIQLSHPLSSPSPSAPNPCQHQSLFQ